MGLFQTINREAQSRKLRFVVIGGLAVNLHGYSRDTADLDLLISRDERSSWLTVFGELFYGIFRDEDAFLQLSPPLKGAWPVDLMLVSEATFAPMHKAGIEVEMYGERVLIPTLEHLLALKLHALRHGPAERHDKDYLDVKNLVRINRIDLGSERIRQLFEKHGTMELYEQISGSHAGE